MIAFILPGAIILAVIISFFDKDPIGVDTSLNFTITDEYPEYFEKK